MNGSRTRWLSQDEQHAWRAFVAACGMFFTAIDSQLQRDAGMPHAYYEILVRLSEAPGRALRMSQLAAAATASKSRASHAVARLEERGWVRRAECPTDRRGQVAELTDEGFEALRAAAPGHVEQVRRVLFDTLTPEQVGQLRAISLAIVAGSRETCASEARAGDQIPAGEAAAPCGEDLVPCGDVAPCGEDEGQPGSPALGAGLP
jgi:DNA-binding MarR family transcriptional regulator